MAGFVITTDGALGQYKATIIDKLKRGENEASVQVGGRAYTQSQWQKVLDDFDKAEDTLEKEAKAAQEEHNADVEQAKEANDKLMEAYLVNKKALDSIQ